MRGCVLAATLVESDCRRTGAAVSRHAAATTSEASSVAPRTIVRELLASRPDESESEWKVVIVGSRSI